MSLYYVEGWGDRDRATLKIVGIGAGNKSFCIMAGMVLVPAIGVEAVGSR